MMGTVALYMRLSSEDANEGESFSIRNQRDLLHNFLKSRREDRKSTRLNSSHMA